MPYKVCEATWFDPLNQWKAAVERVENPDSGPDIDGVMTIRLTGCITSKQARRAALWYLRFTLRGDEVVQPLAEKVNPLDTGSAK